MTMASTPGCGPPAGGDVMRMSEMVIGRARWRGQIVMLTDAPALLTVDLHNLTLARVPLSPGGPAPQSVWGLGEEGGRLFTVSAFDRLLEIQETGALVETARLPSRIANLVDMDAGMAAQLVGGRAGSPLIMSLDSAGRLSPHRSPARTALGLTPSEEGLLHLLSCSVPPAPICWLPADPRVFQASAGGLVEHVRLQDLSPPEPKAVVASPDRRIVDDVLTDGEEGFIVLRTEAGSGRQRLMRVDAGGRTASELEIAEPLRLLVSRMPNRIVAMTRSGRLVSLVK